MNSQKRKKNTFIKTIFLYLWEQRTKSHKSQILKNKMKTKGRVKFLPTTNNTYILVLKERHMLGLGWWKPDGNGPYLISCSTYCWWQLGIMGQLGIMNAFSCSPLVRMWFWPYQFIFSKRWGKQVVLRFTLFLNTLSANVLILSLIFMPFTADFHEFLVL